MTVSIDTVEIEIEVEMEVEMEGKTVDDDAEAGPASVEAMEVVKGAFGVNVIDEDEEAVGVNPNGSE